MIDDTSVAQETVRRLVGTAVIATVLLTITAFWLSYAHLHTVANGHGLNGSRAWAWPGTIDLFIFIGEILILVASVMRRTDNWAISVTIIGSVGSVALNVAGVGPHAPGLNYVVAAVPPLGALLAFGLLMRQIKVFLTRSSTADSPEAEPVDLPKMAAANAQAVGSASAKTPPLLAASTPPVADSPAANTAPTAPANTADNSTANSHQDTPPTVDSTTAPVAANTAAKTPAEPRQRRLPAVGKKPGKAPRRSMDEWVEIASPIFHAEFQRRRRQPTASEFANAIAAAGHSRPSDSTAKNIRTEILDRADVPALSEDAP